MQKLKLSDFLFAMLLVTAFCSVSPAYGQQTTERYIPIGQSPGISGKYSYIGDIVSVDMTKHTIVVDSDRGRRTIQMTPDTKIWVDRTTAKQSNSTGSYSDCQVGRRVEVMHVRDNEGVAEWIKIEAQ